MQPPGITGMVTTLWALGLIAGCATHPASRNSTRPPLARGEGDPAHSIVIHQERDFAVPPSRIYEALVASEKFTAFSGQKAEIDPTVGGAFSIFNGHIIGRNIELVPNQRIVQVWRVVTWDPGDYSIARFELVPRGSGTHLIFDHIGFPEGLHDHLAAGWEEHYWSLLKGLQ